jgi:hypothetical protein
LDATGSTRRKVLEARDRVDRTRRVGPDRPRDRACPRRLGQRTLRRGWSHFHSRRKKEALRWWKRWWSLDWTRGTDQRVARFLKRGIELTGLAVLDPIDLATAHALVSRSAFAPKRAKVKDKHAHLHRSRLSARRCGTRGAARAVPPRPSRATRAQRGLQPAPGAAGGEKSRCRRASADAGR